MERVRVILHEGKEILFLDFSGCVAAEVIKIIDQAGPLINKAAENSLLTLSDVSNTFFDEKVTQAMKHFTANNKPYVKAAAVVGVTGLRKIVYNAVILFSKRNLATFDELEQAKKWLISQ